MGKKAAAALRYDESLPAPFIVASGRGQLAERLLTLARDYGIPVRDAPELAGRLIELSPGTMVPEELFGPVAEVLAFVLQMEEHVRCSGQNEKNSGQ